MTIETFEDRLRYVIGDIPFTKWATDNGFKPSTVNEWLNHGRVPRKDGINLLVKATGIPEHWWLHGVGPPPDSTSNNAKPYPASKATALTLKSPEQHSYAAAIDPLLMHHVMIAVDEMLKKHGKVIDSKKKADLVFLIHDCCKATGGLDEAIVERFINVAG